MRHRGNSSNSSIQHHSFLYSLPLPQRAEFIQSFIVSANATTLLGERAALDVAQRVCARYMSVVRPQHADVVVATSGGVDDISVLWPYDAHIPGAYALRYIKGGALTQ